MNSKCLKLFVSLMILFTISGCSTNDNNFNTSSENEQREAVIKVGISNGNRPENYVDEFGNLCGENYDVMVMVDEMLENIKFEYDPISSQDIILTGLETGTYQVAMFNVFDTKERREKFLYPDFPVSAGTLGMVLSKKYENEFKEPKTKEEVLKKCAELGLKMVPCAPGDEACLSFQSFNDNNDVKLDFTVMEEIDIATSINYIKENRYQGSIFLNTNYANVKEMVDPEDETIFIPFSDGSFKTYVLFAADQGELVSKVNACMEELFKSGEMKKISEKYYGINVFSYLEDFEYSDLNTEE